MKDIIIIDGPRGIGKDTIVKALLQERSSIKKVVTNATRKPRIGEVHGVDYYFITEDEFLKRVKSGDIFEYSTSIYGSYRGMSKSVIDDILKSGKKAVVTPDVVGTRALKKLFPNRTVSIFITAPKELIKQRLEQNKAPDIAARLEDYEVRHKTIGEYDFVVENIGKISEAVDKVIKIVEG
jgi:guanylate kinase